MSDYELLDEAREIAGRTVYRIRAARDIPHHNVAAGTVGGWVESLDNIAEQAWVADDAVVSEQARVSGHALVSTRAQIGDEAQVTDWAHVVDDAVVRNRARVSGHAQVRQRGQVLGDVYVCGGAVILGDAALFDRVHVEGSACVKGTAAVHHDARIKGSACVRGVILEDAVVSGYVHVPYGAKVGGGDRLLVPQDILVLGPIGSESVTVTLARNRSAASGHALRVGCWTGEIDTLAQEVERRAMDWDARDRDERAWREEYAALESLLRIRVNRWTTATSD